jgi:ribosomal protein S3AE
VFKVRQVGKTLVNRTAGTRIASDGLKGRVYEVSLADLQSENDAERSFRKFKLICEDVQVTRLLVNYLASLPFKRILVSFLLSVEVNFVILLALRMQA